MAARWSPAASASTWATGGCYVRPALVRMPSQTPVVLRETFAPILYVVAYDDFDEAIALHNAASQGLSAGIFTRDQAEAELFLATADTGIANVNVATSGAEIGGAFGGEKETGGGASPARTPGVPTCAGPPTPSTTPAASSWPRV